MNKKGQVMIYGFMIAIVVVILAIVLVPALKENIDVSMDSDNLDCTNSSISNFDKLNCVTIDGLLFYFALVLLGIAGAFALYRKFV